MIRSAIRAAENRSNRFGSRPVAGVGRVRRRHGRDAGLELERVGGAAGAGGAGGAAGAGGASTGVGGGCAATVRVRIVTANTTTGNNQSYDPGQGIRIFEGLHPDIALVQELNYGDDSDASIRSF